MKQEINEMVKIPEGITCEYTEGILKCSKSSTSLELKLDIPKIEVSVRDGQIMIHSKKANRVQRKTVNSVIAHIKNIFAGLDEKFTYKLEAVNVHFPMTLKVEGDTLVINNFLGEKVPRTAKILENVDVEIKGQQIIISSHYKSLAGQTAANFEKATKVGNRDRRIFQDGIYITSKPGGEE